MKKFLQENGIYLGFAATLGLWALAKTRLRESFLSSLYKLDNRSLSAEVDVDAMLNETIGKKFNKFVKICVTGGPCAGKTTGIAYLAKKLRERGVNVFIVPEAATLIFTGGGQIDLSNFNDEKKIDFQLTLLKLQTNLENTFEILATMCSSDQKQVILCDRGLMDGKAYLEDYLWYRMLEKLNVEEVHLRDVQYDMVIHMVTAADGTNFYSTLNNFARHETQEMAIEMDRRTQQVWIGHKNYQKIDNLKVSSFDEKLEWMFQEVSKCVGFPYTIGSKQNVKLFLLSNKKPGPIDTHNVKVVQQELEIDYLKSPEANVAIKLEKMTQQGYSIYTVKEKRFKVANDKIVEREVTSLNLTKKQYDSYLAKQSDVNRQRIYKSRICFSYKGQYMLVDQFTNMKPFIAALKVKNIYQQFEIPPFLKVSREIKDISLMKARVLTRNTNFLEEMSRLRKFRKMSAEQEYDKTKFQINLGKQSFLPDNIQCDQQLIFKTYLNQLHPNVVKVIKKIRSKEVSNYIQYFYQEIQYNQQLKQSETKQIESEAYNYYLNDRDKNTITIRKEKFSFTYNSVCMAINIYKITPEVCKLVVMAKPNQFTLPPGIEVVRQLDSANEELSSRILCRTIENLITMEENKHPLEDSSTK